MTKPEIKRHRQQIAIRKASLARALASLEVGIHSTSKNMTSKTLAAQLQKIDRWIEACWRTIYPQRADKIGGGFLRDWKDSMGRAEHIIQTTIPDGKLSADWISSYYLAHHLLICDGPILFKDAIEGGDLKPWRYLEQTLGTLWKAVHSAAADKSRAEALGCEVGMKLHDAIFGVVHAA